jgi:hypothetical protein
MIFPEVLASLDAIASHPIHLPCPRGVGRGKLNADGLLFRLPLVESLVLWVRGDAIA